LAWRWWTWSGGLNRNNVTVSDPIRQLPRFRNSGNMERNSG